MDWGINPDGLKSEVLYLKENYGNPKLYITENGCAMPDVADKNGYVADVDRIRFLRAHLQALHEAIAEGADVGGYFVWSIFDNFEWRRISTSENCKRTKENKHGEYNLYTR